MTCIGVSATTVRVPVFYGHSESVTIETDKKITPQEVKDLLRTAPGVVVMDDVANKVTPTTLVSEGKDEVFVGRIREDISHEKGIVPMGGVRQYPEGGGHQRCSDRRNLGPKKAMTTYSGQYLNHY